MKLSPNFNDLSWYEKPLFIFWKLFFCNLVKEHYDHYVHNWSDPRQDHLECFWCGRQTRPDTLKHRREGEE